MYYIHRFVNSTYELNKIISWSGLQNTNTRDFVIKGPKKTPENRALTSNSHVVLDLSANLHPNDGNLSLALRKYSISHFKNKL